MRSYISINEYARLAKVTPRVIYRLVRAGSILAIRVGRQYRIPVELDEAGNVILPHTPSKQ